MSRKTTLTGNWLALAQAFGGVRALAEAAEISPTHLYHMAHNTTVPGTEVRDRLLALADIAGVQCPLNPLPKPKLLGALDERILMLVGRNLKGHRKIPDDFKERYSKKIGHDLLLEVGTSPEYPEEIHLAVAELLGL